MPGKRVKFYCPKCKQTVKYNSTSLKKYREGDGRLRCKSKWCDYILSKKETCKICDDLFLEKL